MKLTSLSHGAGCACKIPAQSLAEIRQAIPVSEDPNLLVGLDPADDAAVYRLSPDLALVQTIDFFTPIVDDPFDFGRIAAANALSDIYAMGATPLLALNVVAFSLSSLRSEVLTEILRGGAAVAKAAGIAIAGGHSIDDPEPKYGMSVTGVVDPSKITLKSGAEPGDEIFLTKPIGGGLATTAAKRGLLDAETLQIVVDVMTTLNDRAAEEALRAGAHAMTDVTGFGLLGHLHELCLASGVSADIDAHAVPAIPAALELARDSRCRAGGSQRNLEHAESFAVWHGDVTEEQKFLLADAMTSGGLLVAVRPGQAYAPGTQIGVLCQDSPGAVRVAAGT